MLDQAREAFTAGAGWVELLTTMPVLCLAGAGAAAPRLARRLGLRGAIAVALLAITAGLVVRVLGDPTLMIAATVVAVSPSPACSSRWSSGQGFLPASASTRRRSRPGRPSGSPSPRTSQWAWAAGGRPLGSWATLGVLALTGWLAWGRPTAPNAEPARPAGRQPLLTSPLAWTVTAFFGLQAFVAFAVMNWLPLALMDHGVSRTDAGLLLGLLSIVALPVSLLVPPMAGRARGQSGWILTLSGCGAAGLLGLLLIPTTGPWQVLPWVLLLGLGMSVFSLALTVIALRVSSAAQTAGLSGMAQGIGYVIAGTGPFLIGLLHDTTGGWSVPFAVLLAVVVAQAVTGTLAGRPRTV